LLRELQPDDILLSGWETNNPPPLFLEANGSRFVTAELEETQDTWRLCRDDDLLEKADLPNYRSSLSRYLYNPHSGLEGGLVPLTKTSVLNENTVEITEIIPTANSLRPFNPFCGLLEVRRFYPLSYEEYVDLLSGRPWKGIWHQGKTLNVDETWPGLGDLLQAPTIENQLFLGRSNAAGCLAEIFYLKLHLFTQVLRLVRHIVRRTQLPFLNLSGDSFRLRFESRSGALPLFWTTKCSLTMPGQAVALRVKSIGQRFFIRLGGPAHSIYLPGKVNQAAVGNSEVRIRAVNVENTGTTVRGTLSLRQPLLVSSNDILWLRLPVASGMLNFFGHLYPEEALSRLDMPFRTWPLELDEEDVASLQSAAQSFSLPPVPYEVIPMLSSPVDLYSLGVLAIRTFLVNEEIVFQDAVDDMLSLAREMASRYQDNSPLAERALQLIGSNTNWLKRFGPHNLMSYAPDPQQALQTVTSQQWFELLSVIVSLFPGMGPDSVCPDYGLAQHGALETVFDEPLARMERLQVAARNLVIPETAMANRAYAKGQVPETTTYHNPE